MLAFEELWEDMRHPEFLKNNGRERPNVRCGGRHAKNSDDKNYSLEHRNAISSPCTEHVHHARRGQA